METIKYIDRPVEVFVDKPVIVEKIIEKPVEVFKYVEVEKPIETVKVVEIEKIVERPTVIEKLVEIIKEV